MRILLTGERGQVGWELRRALATLGELVAFDRDTLDLTSPDQIVHTVRDVHPDLIINAAAYTAVDRAEEEEHLCFAINAEAPGVLAEEAKRLGTALIHYSTDYVFDGRKAGPYREDDPTSPLNAYGRSKLAGEEAIRAAGCSHLILRTSWVFGRRGNNFATTILRLAHQSDTLTVVDDQIGAPTWCRLLAEGTAQIIAHGGPDPIPSLQEHTGTYHLSAAGQTSWYGFARLLLELDPHRDERRLQSLRPIPGAEYATAAQRPANSLLANDRIRQTFGVVLPYWKAGVVLAFETT